LAAFDKTLLSAIILTGNNSELQKEATMRLLKLFRKIGDIIDNKVSMPAFFVAFGIVLALAALKAYLFLSFASSFHLASQ